MPGIQLRKGILEDHLAVPPEAPLSVPLQKVDAVASLDVRDLRRGQRGAGGLVLVDPCAIVSANAEIDAARGRVAETADAAPQRALATATLAHKANRFAAANVEAHSIHGLHMADDPLEDAVPDGKVFLEVPDGEHDVVCALAGRIGCKVGLHVHEVLLSKSGA